MTGCDVMSDVLVVTRQRRQRFGDMEAPCRKSTRHMPMHLIIRHQNLSEKKPVKFDLKPEAYIHVWMSKLTVLIYS